MDAFPVPSLRAAVETLVGAMADWTQLPTRAGGGAVWRVTGERGVVVLKRHANGRGYAQERAALAGWATRLAPAAPRLLAFDDPTRALAMSELPGCAGTQLDVDRMRAVHRAAGAWLSRLHALDPGPADALSLEHAIERRLRAAVELAPRERELSPQLREAIAWARAHVGAFAGQPRVPTHRDFTPDNWRVDGERLAVLDFEHARADCWLADLVKLAATCWPDHPALEPALLQGYGRALDPEDRTRLRVLVVIHGLATWTWGLRHRDAQLAQVGRNILARVGAGGLGP